GGVGREEGRPVPHSLPPSRRPPPPGRGPSLAAAPRGLGPACEFRHASWFRDETWSLLRAHGAALCIAQTDDLDTPLVASAPFGYARLRREEYSADDLAAWAARLRAVEGWQRGYVFLKHDEAGRAPARPRELLATPRRAGPPG